MAKRTETQLVITAKDLGSAKLKELGAAFRQLRQEQRESAAVADRTKIKQGELQATLSGLNKILGELRARAGKLDYLKKLGEDSAGSKQKIEGLKAALAKLNTETSEAEKKTAAYTKQKNSLEKQLSSEEQRLNRIAASYAKTSLAIEGLGLNSVEAQRQLSRLIAVTGRAASDTELAINRLPREQRLYREELEKTAAAEKQAVAQAKERRALQLAALKDASRARLAQERNTPSGFAAFSKRVDVTAEARLNQERRRAVGILGQLAGALRSATGAQDRFTKSTKGSFEAQRTALSFSQRLRGQLLSLGAAYFGFFGIISQGQRALDVSNQRIALNARLLVANGDDAAAAASDLKFLRDEAERLGFSLTELGGNYSKLAIAGRSAGLATEQVREIFSNFAEVARVNNAGVEETERVFKALEQILSKGKVQAEELRGQLGDVLPGAYSAFARSLGVSGQELDELLKKGQVSSNALLGFSREYAKSVSGQLEPATKTLRAELGRLSTAYDDFLVSVGDQSLAPALREVADNLVKFFQSTEGKEFGADLADAIRGIGKAAIFAAANLGELITFAKLFLAVWAAGKVKAIALSFGAIAGQIAAVGTIAAATTGRLVVLRTGLLAVQAAAGPIGLVLAAISGVLVYVALNANDAGDEMKELADKIDTSAKAMSDAAAASNELANKQDILADAELNLADATQKTADAKAAVAKNGTEAAKASLAQAEAAEKDAKSTRDQAKAKFDLAKQIEENARLEADIQLKASQNRLKEIRQRLAVARATVIQARANAELIRQQTGPIGEPGERAARAGQGIAASQIITRAENNFDRLRALEAEQAKALADLIAGAFSDTSKGGKIPDPPALLTGEDDDKAAKKAAEELKRLKEKAAEEIAQINKDRLEQEAEDEAKALEAKLELNRIEYAERRTQNEKLIADLRAAKQTQLADELAAAQRSLDAQEKIAAQTIKNDAARDKLKKELERREEAINALIEERDRKLADIERRQQIGAITDLDAQNQTYEAELEYQAKVLAAVDALKQYIEQAKADGSLSLLDAMEVDELLLRLDDVPAKVQAIDPAAAKLKGLQEEIAGGLTDTFAALGAGIANAISGVGSFKDAIKGAWDTFRNFIADFLVGLGKAILQVIILQQIQKAFGADSILGQAAGMLIGGNHSGGLVGQGARMHNVNPAIFAAAQRYHSGGVVGLGADEVPIIAKRGEEVLTENDPRHRGNGGMAGQQIKIVNAIDSASVVQEGLRGDAGTRAILNVVRANKAAFKAAIA